MTNTSITPISTPESWTATLLERAEEVRQGTWEFCRLLVQCQDELGEAFYGVVAEVASKVGLDEKTLINYASLCRTAMAGEYDGMCTVGHAAVVARKELDLPQRKALMVVAENRKWSVKQLKEHVRAMLSPGSNEEDEDGARIHFSGTESHTGVITITPAGNRGIKLVFDSENLAFQCYTDELRRLDDNE